MVLVRADIERPSKDTHTRKAGGAAGDISGTAGAAAAGGEDASGGDPAEAGLLDAFNDEHLMPAWFESTARRLWDERGKY